MSEYNNQLIAPPIEEEVYPYRRVWRSLTLQVIFITSITVASLIAQEIFRIELSPSLNSLTSLLLVVTPVLGWLFFSVLPERYVLESRDNLIQIAIVSGLIASAIGIPMVNSVFQVNEWLPLESAVQRIIGYMFTLGIVDTALKFIVIQYMTFPQKLRIRTDAVAYCIASAVGYSFIINLNAIIDNQITFSIVILQTFSVYVMQIISSLILSYGFSESRFSNALPALLPATIIISSFFFGIIAPLSSGLRNGTLTIDGMVDRPLFTLGFLIVVLFSLMSIVFFLYTVSDRREREAYTSSDI